MLTALGESLGLKSELLPRIATCFGGGMGGTHRFTCGAVSAGVMAAGIAFGRDEVSGDKGRGYNLTRRLLRDFEKEFGSIICYELVGIPYEEEDWSEKWQAMNMRDRCVEFVRFVVEQWLGLAGR